MDFEKLFIRYAQRYNRHAKAAGSPLYSFDSNSLRTLRALLYPKKIPGYMTPEQQERFRAEYFKGLLEDINPLAKIGFDRSREQRIFGQKGATVNKSIGATNRKLVIDAWLAILEERKRKLSGHELAKLIHLKLAVAIDQQKGEKVVSVHTVRGHIQKLRNDMQGK